MNRPRMLIAAFSPLTGDARVLKQIVRFRDDYDVVTLGYGPAPEGVAQHLQVSDDAPVWRWPRVALMLRHYRRAYWGNRAVAHADRLLGALSTPVDVAIANDVDTVPLVLRHVQPTAVHIDLHEYAPRQREELWRWRLFVAPFLRWILRTFATRAASSSTVSSGLAREYASEFGLAPSVITNAAPYREGSVTPTTAPIRLVHSGAALASRDLEIMIDAVEASNASVTLDLFLTRNDPSYLERLRQRCAASAKCQLHDPVPYEQLIETLADYDVGVFVLPPRTFNYRWALPNKLFDFVQARLGIIVGPSPEMSWIVNDRSLGAVSPDFTAAALTRVLDSLEPEQVDNWKRGADRAARPLSSDEQVEKWADAVRALRPYSGERRE